MSCLRIGLRLSTLLVFSLSIKGDLSVAVTKVVIPAAGLGTRFLPQTKIIPKEMVPLGNKPAIQHIVEEGIAAGIHDFVIIANNDKQAIFDHFSPCPTVEKKLADKGKLTLLDSVKKIQENATIHAVEQPEPLGLGHAILQAKHIVGNEPFGVILPDDIMISDIPAIAQLITSANKYNASVIAVCEVPYDKLSSYGIVAIKQQLEPNLFELNDLVEKPLPEDAPSKFGIIGRYVLSPRIFQALEKTKPGAGGEIQLTDGIKQMMQNGEKVLALKVSGARYDVGNPIDWLKALNAIMK
ncbi:UTP--glucose-1-phosphate uridylyltransferase [Candidatus Dependentiae bacterium HGW-Dependentiae-1]|nr:MAG: UTP--glucose-1-phosphate uridylyltransferase [Candidatus Dependentiae bacterium HGW-Dependentiae-1]